MGVSPGQARRLFLFDCKRLLIPSGSESVLYRVFMAICHHHV